jgi:hypothetical protein
VVVVVLVVVVLLLLYISVFRACIDTRQIFKLPCRVICAPSL